MRHHYEDIRALIATPPQWFDEHAVPRYCAFHPSASAYIYADEAALVLITCQDCRHPFHVCFTSGARRLEHRPPRPTLAEMIRDRTLHFGDPPNVGCCPAGPTMNSEPRRVIEFWRRNLWPQFGWVRDLTLEIGIEPDWVTGEPGP